MQKLSQDFQLLPAMSLGGRFAAERVGEKPWPWLAELGMYLSIVTYVSPVAEFATVIKVE